jgi:large subunit ribosomal protein L22
MRYSMESDPDTTAKAQVIEADISPKHSVEICNHIRGWDLQRAKEYLERVISKETPVPFRKYNRKVNHRKGKGFGPGRYPVKAARVILKLLEDCENNAEYGGLDPEEMVIQHLVSHRGRIVKGYMPRAHGRSTDWDKHTVNIEIILKEKEGENGQ